MCAELTNLEEIGALELQLALLGRLAPAEATATEQRGRVTAR